MQAWMKAAWIHSWCRSLGARVRLAWAVAPRATLAAGLLAVGVGSVLRPSPLQPTPWSLRWVAREQERAEAASARRLALAREAEAMQVEFDDLVPQIFLQNVCDKPIPAVLRYGDKVFRVELPAGPTQPLEVRVPAGSLLEVEVQWPWRKGEPHRISTPVATRTSLTLQPPGEWWLEDGCRSEKVCVLPSDLSDE